MHIFVFQDFNLKYNRKFVSKQKLVRKKKLPQNLSLRLKSGQRVKYGSILVQYLFEEGRG